MRAVRVRAFRMGMRLVLGLLKRARNALTDHLLDLAAEKGREERQPKENANVVASDGKIPLKLKTQKRELDVDVLMLVCAFKRLLLVGKFPHEIIRKFCESGVRLLN